jgi:hypothetical protein
MLEHPNDVPNYGSTEQSGKLEKYENIANSKTYSRLTSLRDWIASEFS